MLKGIKKSDFDENKFLSYVNKVNLSELSNAELKNKFYNQATTLDCKFAIIKEVIFRIKKIKLFDSQLLTAYYLMKESIVELPTGEGKTLAAVVATIVFASQKHRVHILGFNDYLSKRDCVYSSDIYNFFDFKAGYIVETTNKKIKKNIYKNDIVYVSAKEAGFDYLKDFLANDKNDIVFPDFDIAIIDEADSILLDEARTPLVLAGDAKESVNNALQINDIISSFNESDYEFNKTKKQIWLTDSGISKLEDSLELYNLYDIDNSIYLPTIDAFLQAKFLLIKNKDYIVKNNKVLIIDESTGRVAVNRKFPELIHKAVEIKENLAISENTMIYNSITIQDFIKLYSSISGMTGTAKTSEKEFIQMYDLKVEVVSPHIKCIRKDLEFQVSISNKDNERAVIKEIKKCNAYGKPILLGTSSVEQSERYAGLLKNHNIQCNILNARNDKTEAEIISYAGCSNKVTVSTNISGRGVDIKLGNKSKEDREKVLSAGGLYVISTYLNQSLRIDNQLRGRAGRQGDPGQSKFFISVENEIIQNYYDENEIKKLKKLAKLNTKYSNKILNNAIIKAQKFEQGKDAETRYMLLKYSNLIEQKRKIVSDYRFKLLSNQTKPNIISSEDPKLYDELYSKYKEGLCIAEKQLILYFINMNWADYLSAMEAIKDGIHFVIMGRKNPLEEFSLRANNAFGEMIDDVKKDVCATIQKVNITHNGIDMDLESLNCATTVYTYLIDESKSQFNKMNELNTSVSHTINSILFSMPFILEKIKKTLRS